jgi:hypothetical protein
MEITSRTSAREYARNAIIEVKKEQLHVDILSKVNGAQAENLYQIAKRNGYEGTEQDFINELLAGGDGFYNVDTNYPIIGDYYTLATAVRVVSSDPDLPDIAKNGLTITFYDGEGWRTYRYKYMYDPSDAESFANPDNWEDVYESEIIVISESAYERLREKDPNKFYFTYEDDSPVGPAHIENGILETDESIVDGVLETAGSIVDGVLYV